jgi:ABC-type lipoprotein release transport system permease subunit
MARLTSDVRFALRQVLRSPGFAITAVVTLAALIPARRAASVDPMRALRT